MPAARRVAHPSVGFALTIPLFESCDRSLRAVVSPAIFKAEASGESGNDPCPPEGERVDFGDEARREMPCRGHGPCSAQDSAAARN